MLKMVQLIKRDSKKEFTCYHTRREQSCSRSSVWTEWAEENQ